MNNSLEEKRREIFELHQSWLRPDATLMRKPAPVVQEPAPKKQAHGKFAAYSKKWMVTAAICVAAIFIIIELLFFAFELGWFKR